MASGGPGRDAVVVGSGPNGLAAALTLARAGLRVLVLEGAATAGGGCRTQELTLPGFRHDVCSAVHPLAAASPFFTGTDLAGRGVRLLRPKVAFAHPLDGGRAAAVHGTPAQTAAGLGADGSRYRRLIGPLVRDAGRILPAFLGPLRSVPPHPAAAARFAAQAVLPASWLARGLVTEEAAGLLAGVSGHAMLPLSAPLTGGFGLLLTVIAHAVGWPVVRGGSDQLTRALTAELTSRGSEVITGQWVSDLAELPRAPVTLLDVTPRQFLDLAGGGLPPRYAAELARFRYGPGTCKVDWALDGPVPWTAPACREAGTLHLGGTFAEVAAAEAQVAAGAHPERPFCLIAQPGVVDPTRAPAGRHTLWGYCHVPSGSSRDMSRQIEAQIERFAPGFTARIIGRSVRTAAQQQQHNPNYIGGDINGGAGTLIQTLLRPVPRWNPYRTALPGVYLCSSSTPPGGGVHGMCGWWAGRTALADLHGRRSRLAGRS